MLGTLLCTPHSSSCSLDMEPGQGRQASEQIAAAPRQPASPRGWWGGSWEERQGEGNLKPDGVECRGRSLSQLQDANVTGDSSRGPEGNR